MKPSEIRLTRRQWCLWGGCSLLAVALTAVGCTPSAMRSQSPEDFERVLANVRLVGDVSVPFGFHPMIVERVGLAVNLPNTGSDPPPSPIRSMLITELQRHNVEHPEEVLASTSTSAVIVRAYLKPGLEKGDRFDVEVSVPANCGTTSLRDGWLLPARLREMELLGGSVHTSRDMAVAKGPLLVDPFVDDERKPGVPPHARIVEGGMATISRPIGLVLKSDEKSFGTSKQIGLAINQRFSVRGNGGIKTGVATPKTDGYVELVVHPRYKENVLRYVMVIRSLALAENAAQHQMRMELLERQLLDAVTSATAALRLEAIGPDAKNVLKKGIASSDPEIRFYAAEALAYLDDPAATAPLAAAARDESAFRARALAALSAMDDQAAFDELAKLLDVSSAETRYGAFRALWAMNPHDPLIRGEKVSDQFTLHRIASKGPAMIHVTRAYRPEIVIFGTEPELHAPLIINAGKNIIIRDIDNGRLSVSRFVPSMQDQKREVSCRVTDVVAAIIGVGGSYPDVVQALAQAKTSGALGCRFEVDAVPRADRSYVRRSGASEAAGNGHHSGPDPTEGFPVESPAPDLFPSGGPTESAGGNRSSGGSHADGDRPDPLTDPHERGGPDAGQEADPSAETSGSDEQDNADDAWPLTRRLGKMLTRLRGTDADNP